VDPTRRLDHSAPDGAGSFVVPVPTDVLADATVLIVDDEPTNVRLLEQVIRSAGVGTVYSTCDPREAVRLAVEFDTDLILLDLHMPFLDGFGVMADLRVALPPDSFLPVLVLTADVTPETRDQVLDAGAKDLLHKPFSLREVILRVRNLLETRAQYLALQGQNAALRADLERRSADTQRVADELALRRERIRDVIADRAIDIVYQPIADLRTGTVVGAEALSRFPIEPRRTPDVWFDEAGAVGLGVELEVAAIEVALAGLDQLPPGAFLSVNLSAATATSPQLADLLADVDGERLVLELTEHVPVADYAPLLGALDELRRRGARIAVDDTGAGYAGLSHLLRLRPEVIKLDIELTRDIDLDPLKYALGAALVSFAGEVGAVIVAEGIETPGELAMLRRLGIPWGQGYLLARPAPLPVPTAVTETLVGPISDPLATP
jgi:EAL domain-containing protein (putative c-di-GMP-specific phosphodiesterase class I)